MGGILQGATERKRSSKLPRAPELGLERDGYGGDRTGRSGNSNAQDEKGKTTVRLEMVEMAGEVGVKWTGRLIDVCMQEGRIQKAWRTGLIEPIWQRKRGCTRPRKVQGHHTTQPSTETVAEGSKWVRITRRVEGNFGEEQQGFRKGKGTVYICPETDGREEAGCTGQYGSGVRRPG